MFPHEVLVKVQQELTQAVQINGVGKKEITLAIILLWWAHAAFSFIKDSSTKAYKWNEARPLSEQRSRRKGHFLQKKNRFRSLSCEIIRRRPTTTNHRSHDLCCQFSSLRDHNLAHKVPNVEHTSSWKKLAIENQEHLGDCFFHMIARKYSETYISKRPLAFYDWCWQNKWFRLGL